MVVASLLLASTAAAVAQVRWGPAGLVEVRVALGAPTVWRDP